MQRVWCHKKSSWTPEAMVQHPSTTAPLGLCCKGWSSRNCTGLFCWYKSGPTLPTPGYGINTLINSECCFVTMGPSSGKVCISLPVLLIGNWESDSLHFILWEPPEGSAIRAGKVARRWQRAHGGVRKPRVSFGFPGSEVCCRHSDGF